MAHREFAADEEEIRPRARFGFEPFRRASEKLHAQQYGRDKDLFTGLGLDRG